MNSSPPPSRRPALSGIAGPLADRAPMAVYVLGGSLVAVFVRYLTAYFDSMTLNFYRFAAGAVVLTLVGRFWRRHRGPGLRGDGRKLAGIALLSVMGFVPQWLYTEGVRYTSATLAALITLAGLPVTSALACALFPDEQAKARNVWFLLGAAMALGGTAAVALGQAGADLAYSRGVLYLLAATLIGAASALLARRLVLGADPVSVATVNSGMTALLFLGAALIWGDVARVSQVPPTVVFWLIFSGAFGIFVGVAMYLVALKRQGVMAVKMAELSMPVFTGLWAFLLLGEALTSAQLAGGAVIIAGCVLLVAAKGRASPLPAMPTAAPRETSIKPGEST